LNRDSMSRDLCAMCMALPGHVLTQEAWPACPRRAVGMAHCELVHIKTELVHIKTGLKRRGARRRDSGRAKALPHGGA
jgi:hypothetical protein